MTSLEEGPSIALLCSSIVYWRPQGKPNKLHHVQSSADVFTDVSTRHSSQGLARTDTRLRAGDESNMTDRFVTEARRLWATERHNARLTTLQAGCFLSLLSACNSTDEVMLRYVDQTASLAEDLDVFGDDSGAVPQSENIARAVTAWGFFRWQASVYQRR